MAAGLAPLAIGTETDGSIVCPASACGIVGIKPTNGLVSRRGIVPISPVQDTAGPMAASVADAAALLAVLAAADPEDPVSAAENELAERAGLDPSGAAYPACPGRRRAGGCPAGHLAGRLGRGRASPAAVLEEAVARLRSLGAIVTDPVALPDAEKITEPEFAALRYEFKYGINAYLAYVADFSHGAALPGSWPS